MIEMVYRGTSKDGKERNSLPKNIRQIGDAGKEKRVYIEDYVITFLEKTDCAVLLGEVWQNGSMKCFFADGAVKIESELPEDASWEGVYREMKASFPGREILGWAKKMEELEEETLPEKIADVHREQFPGEDRLLFLYDEEENANVYLTESTGLLKQPGYCIYYEKNEQMQNYMIKVNEGKSVESEAKGQDKAIRSFRRRFSEKYENAPKEERRQPSGRTPAMVRFLYGASMFLVLTILIIGVTMVNNYGRMKDMEVTLQEMALGETQKETSALEASAQAEGEKKTKETMRANETEKTWMLKESSTESAVMTESGSRTKETAVQTGETLQSDSTDRQVDRQSSQSEKNSETNQQTTEKETTVQTDAAQSSNASASSRAAASDNVAQYQAEYTVREGDTLAIVCRMYYGNLDKLQEICDLNGITDPNTILPGQKLVLP
jgi:LysM repeat protein